MWLSKRKFRDLVLLSIGLMIIAWGSWTTFYSPKVKLRRLTITGGSDVGLRHEFAIELASECRQHQIELTVVSTEGSEEAIEQVEKGKIDLALIQGGLTGAAKTNVQQITPLHVEPLHLLVKPELAKTISQRGLYALESRTINVGTLGSGTCSLSQEFLGFLGLQPDTNSRGPTASSNGHYFSRHQSYDEIMAIEQTEALSDAVFSISSLPSPIARHLVQHHDYELIAVPMGEAFALDAYSDRRLATTVSFDKRKVVETIIPAYTYSVSKSVPPQPLKSMGTRLLIVANRHVESETVDRLLKIIYDSSLTKNARPPIDVSVLEGASEYPWHPGALAFIQHNKPLIFGEVMGVLDNSLAIIATLMGGAFFISQWYLRRRQRLREAEFQRYLDAVMVIEKRLLSFDIEARMKVSEMLALRQQVNDLKSDVVRRFSRGELEGEGLMLGFMTLANDARNHITRLLLHERDNVEELAEKENRSVDSLWRERVGDRE